MISALRFPGKVPVGHVHHIYNFGSWTLKVKGQKMPPRIEFVVDSSDAANHSDSVRRTPSINLLHIY